MFVTISGHSEESGKAKIERPCDTVKSTPVQPIDGSTLLQDLPFNLVYRMLDHGLPTNNWRGFAANLHSKYILLMFAKADNALTLFKGTCICVTLSKNKHLPSLGTEML